MEAFVCAVLKFGCHVEQRAAHGGVTSKFSRIFVQGHILAVPALYAGHIFPLHWPYVFQMFLGVIIMMLCLNNADMS